jgi:hypothetical protein
LGVTQFQGMMRVSRTKYHITKEQWATAESNGIARRTVHNRMKHGATVEDAVTMQRHTRRTVPIVIDEDIEIEELTDEQSMVAERNGISHELYYERRRRGWHTFDALVTKPGSITEKLLNKRRR